jgi:hypothetical protein
MDLAFDILGQVKGVRHEDNHLGETALQVMAQGGRQLRVILDKDQGHRALCQNGSGLSDQSVNRCVFHCLLSRVAMLAFCTKIG